VGYAPIVGTKTALIVCCPVSAGLKLQLIVIGVLPVATRLKHPGILLPAREKVTRPATERAALIETDVPLEIDVGTVKVTVIAAAELLVIVREDIAAISLPA
jgi:hypothetical protein